MALFSDYLNGVTVDLSGTTFTRTVWYGTDTNEITIESQTATRTRYEIRGLTKAAAQDGVTALNNPPTVVASWRKMGDGPEYRILVDETATGTWS